MKTTAKILLLPIIKVHKLKPIKIGPRNENEPTKTMPYGKDVEKANGQRENEGAWNAHH